MRSFPGRLTLALALSWSVPVGAQSITDISPTAAPTSAQGPVGPVLLTITGTSFDGVGVVAVGGRLCPVTQRTGTELVCELPEGEGAGLDVDLYEGIGPSVAVKEPNAFSYLAPSLSSITPATPPPTSGGTTLTILGDNFGLHPSVSVGGSSCVSTEQVDHGTALCVLAPGEGVDVDVRLSVANQTSQAPLLLSFAPPSVSSVLPSSAPTTGGIPITITGSNFGVSPSVSVDGRDCPIDEASSSHSVIVCQSPPGEGAQAAGTVDAAGQQAVFSFGYDGPSISSVSPSSGPTRGGFPITINGTNFSASSSVAVGGSSCPLLSASSSELHCALPEGQGSSQDVSVDVAGQQTSSLASFSYDPPVIFAISPAMVPSSGGGAITITGKDFGTSPSVSLDGQDCPLDPTDGAYVPH